MWQSLVILNVFNTLNLKQLFWKTKTFFKKLKYCFLVHTTTNESATFPYKTALPKANVNTSWEYHGATNKNGHLPLTTLFFWKFNFSIRTSIISWFNVPIAQMFIFILFVSASVLFESTFCPWVSWNPIFLSVHKSCGSVNVQCKGKCVIKVITLFNVSFKLRTKML